MEDNGHLTPKLTMKEWQEKLLEELDLSRLESWSPELAASAQSLLAKASKGHTSNRINVMTWALHVEDGSLLQDLTVQNAYTKLRKGSKNVVMVVRNSTAYPQTLRKKTPVARAVECYLGTRVPSTNRVNGGIGRGGR